MIRTYIFLIVVIVFHAYGLIGQTSFEENSTNLFFEKANLKELLISQVNNDGTLDTFDFLKIIDGSDKEHTFIDQNGNEVSHLTFKKKVVLIDFWFLQCRPCIVELPGLELLKKRINSKEFEVITFANDPLSEIEEKLLSKKKFDFRIIPQVFLVSNKSYPTKVLVNKKSEIIDVVTNGNMSQRSIDLLLDKYTPMIKSELRKN